MNTKNPVNVVNTMINAGLCASTNQSAKSVCDHVRTPVWLCGLMVSMLKQWFGSDERISMEKGTFRWRSDQSNSGLYISDDFNWDFTNVQSRPAIIVEIGNFDQIQEIPTIGRSGLVSWNQQQDELNYAAILNSSFTMQCVAKQKLECWAVAWETKLFLSSYADIIREAYGFKKFFVSGVQKPQPMKEAEEYKVAAVQVQFNMIDAWALKRESLKVQTINPALVIADGEGKVELKST